MVYNVELVVLCRIPIVPYELYDTMQNHYD